VLPWLHDIQRLVLILDRKNLVPKKVQKQEKGLDAYILPTLEILDYF
jgi:antibiotic biosynthesis monooxygenase (ABM) superfamily enzyme